MRHLFELRFTCSHSVFFTAVRLQPLSEAKNASFRVFRHVGLGLRLLVPPKSIATIVRPIEEHLLFPQESTALQLQSTIAIVVSSFRKLFQRTISAEKKHGDSWSARYGHVLWPTPTLGRPVRRGRKGLVETTQCTAQGRLNSRPRKAKCFFVAAAY